MRDKTVLAVDPGRSKCGLALAVRKNPKKVDLLWHRVVPRARLAESIAEVKQNYEFELLIVGGGTNSHEAVSELRAGFPGLSMLVIDERNTTLEARERYWEHNPRTGWRRLLPATLQIPPEPVDDFAALVLAERVLIEP